ncbi:MAG: nitroreductase [Pseudonocardiales bacterium]|nr:nitroreductase [Pseudonocardiales bacterium]
MDVTAVRRLEPDFWRAPSAHNTQPWVLRYIANGVDVGWDPAHALPAADPTGRDLRLSLGAFVETCLIVAADAGLAVEYVSDHDERARRVGRLIGTTRPYGSPFDAAAVRARSTNRGEYLPGVVPDDLLVRIDALAGEVNGWVAALPSRGLVEPLAAADRHLFGDAAVSAELADWLRLTPRHPRYRVDGLTDRALALSRAQALGLRVALRALPTLRRAGLPRLLAASSRSTLGYDGCVLVLVAPAGCGPAGDVEFGRVLMRIWLTLSELGLACHPVSQLIDCATTRARLAERLGVADPARLLHAARVGRPAGPSARSARRVQ